MQKLRKKPIEIEAILFTEETRGEIIGWIGDACRYEAMDDDSCLYETHHLFIRGVKGEFYPCKPDVFDATYDPV